MRHLIGNDLNWKSAIRNILNGVFPNILILYGEYGSGKTEFAIDIARMLVCSHLTEDGYCGECPECKRTENITKNTFMTNISLINMSILDYNDIQKLVNENVSIKYPGNKVYIYDEFHTVPKSSQELWLSETRNLDNIYLILTTTKLHQIDKGILSRAITMKMSYLSLQEAYQLLEMYDIKEIDNSVMTTIYHKFRGAPREIISVAKYCINSGLTIDEQIEFIENNRKVPLEEILLFINNKHEYMVGLRNILSTYTTEEIITSTDTFVWNYLLMEDDVFNNTQIGELYTKKELITLTIEVQKQPTSAFLTLYSRKRLPSNHQDMQYIKTGITKHTTKSKNNSDERGGLSRW